MLAKDGIPLVETLEPKGPCDFFTLNHHCLLLVKFVGRRVAALEDIVAVVADHVFLREVDNLISPRLWDRRRHVFARAAFPNGLALDGLGVHI